MKFMLTWSLYPEAMHDTITLFAGMKPEEEQAMMGDKIKMIGRWHNLVSGEGVAIVESDSADAISAYALQWNRFMDLDIAMVVDDDEARAIGRSMP